MNDRVAADLREPLAARALAIACIPFLGVAAIPVALVARRRIRRDLSTGEGLTLGALALSALWLSVLAALVVVHGPNSRDTHGQVRTEQEVNLFDLRPGDCLTTLPASDEDRTLNAIPCDRGHRGEVFAVTKLTVSGYPGDEGVRAALRRTCDHSLEDYLGGPTAGFDLDGYYPTAVDWNFGARGIICVAARSNGELMTRSIKGSGGRYT